MGRCAPADIGADCTDTSPTRAPTTICRWCHVPDGSSGSKLYFDQSPETARAHAHAANALCNASPQGAPSGACPAGSPRALCLPGRSGFICRIVFGSGSDTGECRWVFSPHRDATDPPRRFLLPLSVRRDVPEPETACSLPTPHSRAGGGTCRLIHVLILSDVLIFNFRRL
jgi:hypothetical protein